MEQLFELNGDRRRLVGLRVSQDGWTYALLLREVDAQSCTLVRANAVDVDRLIYSVDFNPCSGLVCDGQGKLAWLPRSARSLLRYLCDCAKVPYRESLVCLEQSTMPRLLLTSSGLGCDAHERELERLLHMRLTERGRKGGHFVFVPDAIFESKAELSAWTESGERLGTTHGATGPRGARSLKDLRDAGFDSATAVIVSSLGDRSAELGFGEEDRTAAWEALERADVLWFSGGDVAALACALRSSGAASDKGGWWLYRLLAHGAVFVGHSAGSIIAGESLQPMLWSEWLRLGGATLALNSGRRRQHQSVLKGGGLDGFRLMAGKWPAPGTTTQDGGSSEKDAAGGPMPISVLPHTARLTERVAQDWAKGLGHGCVMLFDPVPSHNVSLTPQGCEALLVCGREMRYVPATRTSP